MRTLVIEDERKVARFIRRALEEERYAVDLAENGEDGLALAELNPYDVIVLDLMLPRMGGIEILRALRRNRVATPILVLTAKDATRDKVTALDSGADDYLTKPFSIEEFIARVRALLRRGRAAGEGVLRLADLSLDVATRRASRAGKSIDLTPKEYAILEYMLRNPGRVHTRTMIAEHVWNIGFDTETNVIDVYINHLRNKVDRGFPTRLIHTVRGAGYVLKEAE